MEPLAAILVLVGVATFTIGFVLGRKSKSGLSSDLAGSLRDNLEAVEQRARERDTEIRNSVQQVVTETAKLSGALTDTRVIGGWGEIQLRRVLEMSGLSKLCDFSEQETFDDGSVRPDATVKLPRGRVIIIDSKATVAPVEANEDSGEHYAASLKSHVKQLAAKNYGKAADSPLVVMFVPGEHSLPAALAADPDLLEYAIEHGIALASPSTLLALLRVVEIGYRNEEAAENATSLAAAALDLYDRSVVMMQHLHRAGKAISSTVTMHNRVVGSFNSRVIPASRKIERLGGLREVTEEMNPIEGGIKETVDSSTMVA